MEVSTLTLLKFTPLISLHFIFSHCKRKLFSLPFGWLLISLFTANFLCFFFLFFSRESREGTRQTF